MTEEEHWYSQFAGSGGGPTFLADFTVTRGHDLTPWYSRRGGETHGDAVGDLTIVPGVTVDRINWNRDGNFRLIFNTDGDPLPWINGDGANAEVTVTVGAHTLTFDMADREGQGTWGFRFQLTSTSDRQVLGSLDAGHDARFTIRNT